MLHSQRHLAQHLTSTRPNHVHSDNLILLSREDKFDKTSGFTLGLCAVDLTPGEFDNAYLFVLLLCLIRGQAHTGGLWVGKGTPRDDAVIDFLLPNWYQSITHRDSGLIGSNMGKEIAPNDISNRQNVG